MDAEEFCASNDRFPAARLTDEVAAEITEDLRLGYVNSIAIWA
ncbi:hypothetical protein [Chamaesiphon minutus]|nr:hypothetical protein [Chamaesiphon minutus]